MGRAQDWLDSLTDAELAFYRDEFVVDPEDPGASLTNTHDPKLCAGRHCTIHNPSDHHMRDWPMVWRPSKGIFERKCPHGVGHTDPDDQAYLVEAGQPTRGYHGCDGCCDHSSDLYKANYGGEDHEH